MKNSWNGLTGFYAPSVQITPLPSAPLVSGQAEPIGGWLSYPIAGVRFALPPNSVQTHRYFAGQRASSGHAARHDKEAAADRRPNRRASVDAAEGAKESGKTQADEIWSVEQLWNEREQCRRRAQQRETGFWGDLTPESNEVSHSAERSAS
jgi:hypothetical protein